MFKCLRSYGGFCDGFLLNVCVLILYGDGGFHDDYGELFYFQELNLTSLKILS